MIINNILKMKYFYKILLIILLTILLIITTAIITLSLTMKSPSSSHQSCGDLIVELPSGRIQGRNDISPKGNRSFYSFLEIPYGRPPIGKLRFMSPKPAEKWDGILDCTNNTKFCYHTFSDDVRENEDCLYLNVYTPVKPNTDSSVPVMFYIYGTAFNEGNMFFEKYGPQYFMEEDVIIVIPSYRLGPFGFLSTNDDVILGNAGLKDQHLALKWTNENIHLFGGDPKKITIFGESSGGACIAYHILSRKSADLFRAAICQSGSALGHWANQRDLRSLSFRLATFIDPQFNINSTSEELLSFLQNVNTSVLDRASHELYEAVTANNRLASHSFGPVIEVDVEDAFVTKPMHGSFAMGDFNQVPLIIGICSEEALYFMRHSIFYPCIEYCDENPDELITDSFHIDNKTRKQEIGILARKMYTDGLLADDLSADVRYFSDNFFTRPIIRQAFLQSNYNDVYFYQFSYAGKSVENNTFLEGLEKVGHADDLGYLWYANEVGNITNFFPQSDITVLERYVRLFTNFAKYLNPTPEPEDLLQNIIWPKFMVNNLTYLNINTSLEIQKNPKGNTYNKWVDFFEKYAIKPYDTY